MSTQLNPALLAVDLVPGGPLTFQATMRARGEYMPLAFVLRLSPLVHQALAAYSQDGIATAQEVGLEGAQAFSTYLHETIHWWQHIGSTYGLMSSLSYPSRMHGSYKQIKQLIALGALKKSVKRMIENDKSPSGPDTVHGLANVVVNNHFDLSAFGRFSFNQTFAKGVAESPYFENLGHALHMTYLHNLFVMAGAIDKDFQSLPDPRTWESAFRKLKEDKEEGFYYGSPISLWPIGAREVLEGQACFSQIQYLHFASGGNFEWDAFRDLGILHGMYEAAFKEFLACTELNWPSSINHPTVGLFLLVCDLAINPGLGFPFDLSPHFRTFIDDTMPGARFSSIARLIRLKLPELLGSITKYSREEYEAVSNKISALILEPSPMQITAKCEGWARGPMRALMEEYKTYEYGPENLVVRVLLSHFLAFAQDKLAVPEIFCWPGAWMSGDNLSEQVVDTFERHQALFVDRETDTGIYPRMRKNYSEVSIQSMFDDFYATTVVYEMTDQLIVRPGPFDYKYDWLKPSAAPEEFRQFADRQFKHAYGVHPDEIEIVTTL